MKSKSDKFIIFSFLFILILSNITQAQSSVKINKEFNLSGDHSTETQYYILESKLNTFALNGERIGTDIFRLHLKCVPSGNTKKEGDAYICKLFSWKQGDSLEVTIPAIKNWSYVYTKAGIDSMGQVFGIDHEKFEKLVDNNGKALPPDKAYHIYNAFIDFHSFCNVFAEKIPEGNGIQNLTKIGQEIIHDASFSEPPVNLGSNISKGSYFRNGKITLNFKGLSVINDRNCALVGFDSGESSFKIIMQPMPNMKILTVGSSHYMGDIYKDLSSNWVQKVSMNEIVISETKFDMPPYKINSVAERFILISNVDKKMFESRLQK